MTAQVTAPAAPPAQSEPAPEDGWIPIGPDQEDNLRTLRPYFLVPLLGESTRVAQKQTLERIRRWVESGPAVGRGAVTDLFIFCHGWHENFFRATSVYDRLTSRIIRLWRSQRLHPPDGFQPLFLNLHYHSDPGQDGWTDRCGRREKASFLGNVRQWFEPSSPRFRDSFEADFEQIFAFFTHTANPTDQAPHGNGDGEVEGRNPIRLLERYGIIGAPETTLQEKVALAWSCYHEADPEPPVDNQKEKRRRFLPPWKAAGIGAGFFAQALKPTKVGGLVLLALFFARHPVEHLLWRFWLMVTAPFRHSGWPAIGPEAKFALCLTAVLGIASWLVLLLASRFPPRDQSPSAKPPVPVLAAWLILQILLAIPLMLYCLLTFLFGGIAPHPWLFDERYGKRNEDTEGRKKRSPHFVLAQVAQYPATLLRRTAGGESQVHRVADKADAQLSFWLMQRKSVEAGEAGAEFLAELLAATPSLSQVRIHLFGHSFGVLIAPNLARQIVLSSRLQQTLRGRFPGSFASLTLLGAAFAADWFRGETRVRESIRRIGCVFSRYDTANSFYYPFSNHGRVAAGSVGLYGDFATAERGRYVVLAGPPDLAVQPEQEPAVINIDASRILYRGKDLPRSDPKDVFKPGAGGSHDDIFNDEAMFLVWAVTGLEQPQRGESRETGRRSESSLTPAPPRPDGATATAKSR